MENNCVEKPGPIPKNEILRSWSFWRPFLGIVIGGLAGFLYYHFVGCISGTCPITNNPFRSTAAGVILGFLLVYRPCVREKC
jgi:H+/Cl- antiporter ClcA